MRFLRWLYGLPGRINRSFGSTAAATNVGSPGMLTSDVSAMGAKVVMGEVGNATTDETDGSHPDDVGRPHDSGSHQEPGGDETR
jgi:hypothetical protein